MYDKGCLSENSIKWIEAQALLNQLPLVVDPKSRNFHTYTSARLFKPNQAELEDGLGLHYGGGSSLKAIREFLKEKNHQAILFTRGAEGLSLVDSEQVIDIQGIFVPNPHAIGAGDVVVAMSAMGIASGIPIPRLIKMVNFYAAMYCGTSGISPVHPQDFVDRATGEGI